MELQDAIRKRRMVRTFDSNRPVPEEALERILRNGTRAPSAGFSQGQAWLVLRDADLEKFWQFGSDAIFDSVRTVSNTASEPNCQNFSRSASRSTSHACPCEKPADGARVPLCRIRSSASSGTGRLVSKVRTIRRLRIAS